MLVNQAHSQYFQTSADISIYSADNAQWKIKGL